MKLINVSHPHPPDRRWPELGAGRIIQLRPRGRDLWGWLGARPDRLHPGGLSAAWQIIPLFSTMGSGNFAAGQNR